MNHMKKSIVFVLALILIINSIMIVSAYTELCLTKGQSVPSASNPRYTCHSTICQICVTDNFFPTNPNKCDKACVPFSGNSTIDKQPPTLTINSPINNEVYNKKMVLFNITSDEKATIYWKDNNDPKGTWKRLIANANSFSRGVGMKEGLNNISIKGTDLNDNSAVTDLSFYVDSKNPIIRSVSPMKGFTDGNFNIEFKEDNPASLDLHYGNNATGFLVSGVDLNNSCTLNKDVHSCNTHLDLSAFNGQSINYWFSLKDIANNEVHNRNILLSVDTTPPVLNNPTSFWLMDILHHNKIHFNMNITESNFDSVNYIDRKDTRPKWKVLCPKLKNNGCIIDKTFTKGDHQLDVMISDKAGNAVSTDQVVFTAS